MVAFQPSQPVEAPSLGYGAPLADPLTVYTSPNQVGFRLCHRFCHCSCHFRQTWTSSNEKPLFEMFAFIWAKVSFCAISYWNTNSLQLFWENSSLNLANFTNWVIFRINSRTQKIFYFFSVTALVISEPLILTQIWVMLALFVLDVFIVVVGVVVDRSLLTR